jgi:hypothetical protein
VECDERGKPWEDAIHDCLVAGLNAEYLEPACDAAWMATSNPSARQKRSMSFKFLLMLER